ncbi:hypothetical protein CHISP_1057 [Chitinispirillum alkaliphilum]|nr:hypothetical protein CHISP_1057 [Chitinispirillum alkaliphilum]
MSVKSNIQKIFRHRGTQLWLAPVIGVFIAGALAALMLFIDAVADWGEAPPFPVFIGEANTARDLLAVIAASVTTLLALIFTIITVAIQLASSQYSPRTLHILLTDRPSHTTIGIFIGTFTYTLIVLLSLRTVTFQAQDSAQVAGVSMTGAFVIAVVSLGTFAIYSNHIIHSVRITSIINRISTLTRQQIIKYHPDQYHENSEKSGDWQMSLTPQRVILSPKPGVFTNVNIDGLISAAQKTDCILVVIPPLGTFVPQGTPLIRVFGGEGPEHPEEHIILDTERTLTRDIGYGIRQLVDIATRALSTGINDPSTAVQVIDQLHDLMRLLAWSRLPGDELSDESGSVRLIVRTTAWEDSVHLALEEIRLSGISSLQVVRRLQGMLDELIENIPEDRIPPLQRQRDLFLASIPQKFKTS